MANYSDGLSSQQYYDSVDQDEAERLKKNQEIYDALLAQYGAEYADAQTAEDASYADTTADLKNYYDTAAAYNDKALADAVAAETPYVSAGNQALTDEAEWQASHGDFANEYRDIARQASATDGYRNTLSSGIDAVGSQAARAGSFFSGATQLAADVAQQNIYSEAVAKLWDQAQAYSNARLSSLSGTADRGQTAASNVAAANSNAASNNSSLASAYGNDTTSAYGAHSSATSANTGNLMSAQSAAAGTYASSNDNAYNAAANSKTTGYAAETQADANSGK